MVKFGWQCGTSSFSDFTYMTATLRDIDICSSFKANGRPFFTSVRQPDSLVPGVSTQDIHPNLLPSSHFFVTWINAFFQHLFYY